MTPRVAGWLRTGVTLAVLSLLLAIGVARGLDAVSKPFPERAEAPVCVDSPLSVGDLLRPAGVTVSVINAGGKSGLARRTLDELEAQQFAPGEVANVPDKSVRSAQIWSSDGRTPAVRLVQSYLGGKVTVIDRDSSVAGITVVVGDQFPGVRQGKARVKVGAESTVCSPPALS